MENVFTIVEDDSENTLSNVITDYQAAEQFETDKWGDMVREAAAVTDMLLADDERADAWKVTYLEAESVQVGRRDAAELLKPEDERQLVPRTKGGKIVASKAFPKTWNTDKAIIGKALAAGCALMEDGNPKAKTALQTEYKEAAADQDDKPVMEKLQTVANTWNALFGQLTTDDERDFARKLLSL